MQSYKNGSLFFFHVLPCSLSTNVTNYMIDITGQAARHLLLRFVPGRNATAFLAIRVARCLQTGQNVCRWAFSFSFCISTSTNRAEETPKMYSFSFASVHPVSCTQTPPTLHNVADTHTQANSHFSHSFCSSCCADWPLLPPQSD